MDRKTPRKSSALAAQARNTGKAPRPKDSRIRKRRACISRPWRQFEIAVHEFVRTLDPTAVALFDHRVPDRDTGRLRQVDVWINAKLGRHIPYTVLVSCKNIRRPLDVPVIESLQAQVASTGANMGVVYSSSGFTRSALEKAKANGLTCCRLYQNEPADIPVIQHYACASSIRLSLPLPILFNRALTWNELFDLEIDTRDGRARVIDSIEQVYYAGERQSVAGRPTNQFPVNWSSEIQISTSPAGPAIASIRIDGYWRKFVGRLDAHLLKGSYCFANNSFLGDQAGPIIDRLGSHPGPGWELLAGGAPNLQAPFIIVVMHKGHFAERFRQKHGSDLIPNSRASTQRMDRPTEGNHESAQRKLLEDTTLP